MDLRKIRNQKKGFTLIELMVVIVIIGILVAIALPNFISAQDRAKVSSVKANMHTLQTCSETYSVDNSGVYSTNIANLKNEGGSKTYWKELKNPFNGQTGASAYTDVTGGASIGATQTAAVSNMNEGMVGYASVASSLNPTTYAIYGAGKSAAPVTDKGSNVFFLSNS